MIFRIVLDTFIIFISTAAPGYVKTVFCSAVYLEFRNINSYFYYIFVISGQNSVNAGYRKINFFV